MTDQLLHSFMGHSSPLAITHLFIDQFGRSLQFCHLEIDKDASSDVCSIEHVRYKLGFWISSDFRELSFCSPRRPSFFWKFFIKIRKYTVIWRKVSIKRKVLERLWKGGEKGEEEINLIKKWKLLFIDIKLWVGVK